MSILNFTSTKVWLSLEKYSSVLTEDQLKEAIESVHFRGSPLYAERSGFNSNYNFCVRADKDTIYDLVYQIELNLYRMIKDINNEKQIGRTNISESSTTYRVGRIH